MPSGYTSCACRDCFETAVSEAMDIPDLCNACVEAGCDCDGESECLRNDAYSCDDELQWVYFDAYDSGAVEFSLTLDDALSCSGSGQQDENVAAIVSLPYVQAQLSTLTDKQISDALKGFGAWDDDERTVSTRAENAQRLVWCAACDIRDEHNGR